MIAVCRHIEVIDRLSLASRTRARQSVNFRICTSLATEGITSSDPLMIPVATFAETLKCIWNLLGRVLEDIIKVLKWVGA